MLYTAPDIGDAKIQVLKIVRKRVDELRTTVMEKYEWVKATMPTSIEMLYNVANSFLCRSVQDGGVPVLLVSFRRGYLHCC